MNVEKRRGWDGSVLSLFAQETMMTCGDPGDQRQWGEVL
jgi:hypothetical protein